MKKIFASLLLLICATTMAFAQSRTIENLRNKFKNDQDAKVISLNGSLFSLASTLASFDKSDEDVQTFARIAEGIESMKIITIPMRKIGTALLREMRDELKNEQYDELMTVKDESNNIYFLAQPAAPGDGESVVRNVLVLIHEKDEFMVLDIVGSVDMKDLAYLAQNHSNWN